MNVNTLIGLSFLYLTLNFLIIVFFVGASEWDYYEEGDKWMYQSEFYH